MSQWDDRIQGTVLEAIKAGVCIYTGFGELMPGARIEGQSMSKPAMLPTWQTYMDPKPGNPKLPQGQPGVRFLRFVQKTKALTGAQFGVYPTLPATDAALGVPLAVPLGEGVDHTPADEMDLKNSLEAHVLYKPVRIIGIGRYRTFTTGHSAPILEPIILEVYSEGGELVWENPRLTLEEAIEASLGAPMSRTIPTLNAPTIVRVPVVPHTQPTMTASAASRMDLGQMFDDLAARGLSREDILENVSRTTTVPLPIVTAAYAKHTRAAERAALTEGWSKAIDQCRSFDLEGEDLVAAVAEMVHAKPEDIRAFIQNPKAIPAPAAPAPADGIKRTPRAKVTPLQTAGDVASALGAGTSVEVLDSHATVNRPAGSGSAWEETQRITSMIANKKVDYQAKALEILAKHNGPMESAALRAELGIPSGASKDDRKAVGHAFLRNVIRPLLRTPAKITQHGTQRATSYTLAE